MNTLALRRLIRQYGALGYLMVGSMLLTEWLFRTRRREMVVVLLLAVLGINYATVRLLNVCIESLEAQSGHIAQAYEITDLGVLPGYEYSFGYGINNKGQAVGLLADEEFEKVRGFVTGANGKPIDIGTTGSYFSVAMGINDASQVVGVADIDDETAHGFMWQNGKFTDLPPLKGGEFSYADAINNKGQAVGFSDDEQGMVHAVGWQNGKVYDISHSCPGVLNVAVGINDNTDVIGIFTEDGDSIQSFLWSNDGTSKVLPSLGGDVTVAAALNNKGEVVACGNMERDGEEFRAFLWHAGSKPTPVGSLGGRWTVPAGINNHGEVVGTAETRDGMMHAFVAEKGKIQDLNRLVPSGSRWILLSAMGVNDKGQITGTGIVGNTLHAFVLTPKK